MCWNRCGKQKLDECFWAVSKKVYMRNVNYNLVKLLLAKMDHVWRLENYYLNDAKQEDRVSIQTLEQILEDEKRHVEMLRREVARRCGGDGFFS